MITIISILSIFAGFLQSVISTSSTAVCLLGPQLLQRPADGRCSKYFFNESSESFQPTWLYTQFCEMDKYPNIDGIYQVTDPQTPIWTSLRTGNRPEMGEFVYLLKVSILPFKTKPSSKIVTPFSSNWMY